MAKFAIECPKCGSVNTASTFIFSKKIIKCGTCGEEIDVKQSRLTSKICPNCGKVFVCDQAKIKGAKCPSCGANIDVNRMATAKYKLVNITCPQCSCSIEVDKTKDTYSCPICDYTLDVKKVIAKQSLVSDTGVSIIKYEGDNSTFVWKHPTEDFNLGSILIVHESQEAVLFLNGEALDTFGAGRYTLDTANMPILKKIYSLPTGNQTPFHAEVYFINTTVQLGMKWGTDARVRFIDPITNIPLDIGASGELNLQVSDSRKLLFKLVGTTNGLVSKDILSNSTNNSSMAQSALRGFFRAPLMTEIKSYLSAVIREQNINIFEIDSHMSELSDALRLRIAPRFEEYGITIPQFYITNIILPEDDKNFKDIRALISQAYIGVKSEEVKTSVAMASRQRQLVEEQTKAQIRMIQAQTDAEAAKAMGYADADVMMRKGYTGKDVLEADVQKEYAKGIGNMGGGSGTAGGGVLSETVSVMAGIKMAETIVDKFSGAMDRDASHSETPAAYGWACPSCGAKGITSKCCPECGAKRPTLPETWDCTSCGARGLTSKCCPECGAKRPAMPETWDCTSCGAKGLTSKCCPECGAKRPALPEIWDCTSCGAKGITSKCCPECGAKKPV